MATKVLNIEELGIKIETMITFGHARLSDIFVVIGSADEGYENFNLDERFVSNLKENLADKNPQFLPLVDTSKIKVFFSKNCLKFVEGAPVFTRYILDHRKFAYPSVSMPKSQLKIIL